MVKKLAQKEDKRLLTDLQIKELKLNPNDFTSSWQGRIFISNPSKSFIASQIGISEKGEYAIKVR